MSNKRFNDQNPASKDGPDSATPAGQPSGKTKPTSNPSDAAFKGPTHARIPSAGKGSGKDLPAVNAVEKLHQQPTGDLPKGI